MFFHVQKLINEIIPDEPDPAAANALQEGLGGQFGEMRTMMQYLFQSFNFRGNAKPYRDLIQGIGVEEISHVELIATTWSGSYVYNSGNLVLDLLYNLMLEATGRLQKCRLYEMINNKTARSTISYLIVRDHAHENAYAKALETLGVSWGKVLPIPNFDVTRYPEVKKLMDQGLQNQQHHWRLDGSEMAKIFKGPSPSKDGELMTTPKPPDGAPIPANPERPEEFAPALTPELMKLVEQAAKM